MSCDLMTKCRTCLCDSHIFHKLYGYVDENYQILEMLDGIVPQIDIKASSNYSSLVCQSCVGKLVVGYKFQQLCIETNKRLHDLMDFSIFDTAPKLEKTFDPLTGEPSFKMKIEVEDSACFECEINPEQLEAPSNNDNDWGPGHNTDNGTDSSVDAEASFKIIIEVEDDASFECEINPEELEKPADNDNDWGPDHNTDNDTDSSNEKLPVLKESKDHKYSKSDEGERLSKNNRRKGQFRCGECNKVFFAEKTFKAHILTHENEDITQSNIEVKNESKDEINIDIYEQNYCKENDIAIQKFQCPDCPKCFEKKAFLSTHYKVHTKKTENKSNKDTNSVDDVGEEDVEKLKSLKNVNETELDMEKESKVIVKEEIEVIEDSMDELDANAECFNNDYDDSDDNSEKNALTIPGAKHIKNMDFIDTVMGEIEKPIKVSGNFPCAVCGKVFDRPYSLKRHSSVHSISKPHECKICKYRFDRVNSLKAHMGQHDGDGTGILMPQCRPEGFKCPYCPRRFEKQASLSAHRQIHTRNAAGANYPCMVCKRNFMSVTSLTEHITNKHPEVEKHKCDQCDKTFVIHAHLVEHLNRHRGNENLLCLICEKEFGYTKSLKEHMRTHSGQSAHLCLECGKTFRRANKFRQHMERHKGLKKYQCPECPSRFKCRPDMIKHTSTHTNAKPHMCDICGSRFTQSSSLKKHKFLHTGERPFKCDQCSMTFAVIDHLRRHMRTHTGEKPYKCKYCGRAFAGSPYLTKHLKTHVGENTYMCDQCPMAFKYQAELKQHQSEHYKMAQKLVQHHQELPLPIHNHNQQIIISDQNHLLTIAIPNHHLMTLVDHHSQQLSTIVEQTDVNEAARQDNIDIKNLSS